MSRTEAFERYFGSLHGLFRALRIGLREQRWVWRDVKFVSDDMGGTASILAVTPVSVVVWPDTFSCARKLIPCVFLVKGCGRECRKCCSKDCERPCDTMRAGWDETNRTTNTRNLKFQLAML